MKELIKVQDKKNLPAISIARVNKAEMLLSCSEKQLLEYRMKINVLESIGDGMSHLVGKEISIKKEIVYAIIERILAGLSLSLNVGKNLETYQLETLAVKIYSKYYYLSFEELMHVFDKGARGGYGKLYDRLDEEIIFTWLEKYDTDERLYLVEKSKSDELQKQHEKRKEADEFLAKHLSEYTKVLNDAIDNEKEKEKNFIAFRQKYFSQKDKTQDLI